MNSLQGGIKPMLYKLRVDKDKYHYLEPEEIRFNIPGKDYGDIVKRTEMYFKAFKRSLGSMGILLTGNAGTGKTRLAEKICNLALDNNMPVVIVTDIRTSINTVNYISMLRNVVILFDEFAKNFDRPLQDKMLSMLSGVSSGKKLFLMTENNSRMISEFILNRPGRVRYHIDFERLDEAVLIGYCNDHFISNDIYKKIYKLYEKSTMFSFDHLQAIVTELEFTPTDDFDDIINRLNLSVLTPKEYIHIEKILDKEDVRVPLTTNDKVLKKDFLTYRTIYISGVIPPDKPKEENTNGFMGGQGKHVNFTMTKDDIVEILEDGYICKVDDYKIYIKVM